MRIGLQVAVHVLSKLPPIEEWARFLQHYRVGSVSFKLVDGTATYNQQDVPKLREYLAATAEICQIGQWPFTYGYNPGPEAAKASEMIEKYPALSFIDIDAEGNGWNQAYGMPARANTYMNSLDIPKRIEVYVNSYRYPKYFPRFPWSAFFNHPKLTGWKPQVYWLQDTRPEAGANNVQGSYDDYLAKGLLGNGKTFFPMLPTFAEGGWEPTEQQLYGAIQRGYTLGFMSPSAWKVDWVFQYDRWDWMRGLTGKEPPDDTSPPPPLERIAQVLVYGLRLRLAPSTTAPIVGSISYPATVKVLGELIKGTDGREWAYLGDTVYACFTNNDGTPYMKFV